MSDETQALTPGEPSLDELLAQIVTADESGQPVDRQLLLARHPQFAADLREFFANRDQMRRLAGPLRGSAGGNGSVRTKLRYFGDYELLDEIAAGGMGIVYKARQVSLNRIVAVKMILKGTLASEDDVKRFRAEAEAAASLQHPGIVAIHEVGLHEGQHYFSMDFVEGQSLAQLPREQPLAATQAAEYVKGAAEAVHYAHQQGTLHRDLKPSNILIDAQGRVRITDFGLAKRIEGNSDLTLTGQILGTPAYMPPEQALSKRSLIGTASDVYSLGAVLYELLAGRPPFRGESPAETLRQVESLDPLSPRLLNPTTPRDLETICLKCLEKEPHKRYATAQLAAEDLGRYLRHEPIHARPIGRLARAWRWCRRKPSTAAMAAISGIAAVVLIGGLMIANVLIAAERERVKRALSDRSQALVDLGNQQQATREALNRERKAVAEKTGLLAERSQALLDLGKQQQETRVALDRERKAVAEKTGLLAERDAANAQMRDALSQQQRLSYYHLIDLAWREAQAGRGDISKTFLDDCRAELRGWEWRYIANQLRAGAASREAGAYRLLSVVKGKIQNSHRTATFSGDGRFVASIVHFDGEKRTLEPVRIWNAATGEEVQRCAVSFRRGPLPSTFDVTFDPLNKFVAVASDLIGIDLLEVESREILHTFQTRGAAYRANFSADGKFLLAAHVGGLTVWDVAAQTEVRRIEFKGKCCGAVFNKQAAQVVTGSDIGEVAVWEVSTGKKLVTLKEREFGQLPASSDRGHSYCNAVVFSPDYRRIAAAFASGYALVWDAQTHEQILMLKGHNHWIYNIAFNHDGTRIVTAGRDGTIKVWDANTFREILTLRSHEGRVFCAVFSPDDQSIASTADDGTIRVWDAPHLVAK